VRDFNASSAERRARGRSFDLAQDRLSGGVLRRYVGARRLSATKQMGLFQRSVIEIDKPSTPRLKYGPVGAAKIRKKVWTKDSVQSAEDPVERIKKG